MFEPQVALISIEIMKTADRHGEKLGSLDRPLWDVFLETARSHPHRDALVSLWQTGHSDCSGRLLVSNATAEKHPSPIRWTYEDLVGRAESLASALQARGCVAGMSLVVLLGNSAEWALFFWAAAKLRICFVPLDPRLLTNAPEMTEILDLARPDVLAVSDTKAARALAGTESAAMARVRIQTSPFDEAPPGWLFPSSVHLLPGTSWTTVPPPSEPHTELQDVAVAIFTSGTTSTPKGCLHTPTNLSPWMVFSLREATAEQTRQAVEVALAPRPVLRTVLVRIDAQSFCHVAVRKTAMLDRIIRYVEVSNDEGLDDLAQDDSANAFQPQLSVQAKSTRDRSCG